MTKIRLRDIEAVGRGTDLRDSLDNWQKGLYGLNTMSLILSIWLMGITAVVLYILFS